MSTFIIERYIYDALNAHADLAGAETPERREIAQGIVRDVELYFAEHMEDVLAARARLAQREDADGRAMLDFLDETLVRHEDADREAKAAIDRARRS